MMSKKITPITPEDEVIHELIEQGNLSRRNRDILHAALKNGNDNVRQKFIQKLQKNIYLHPSFINGTDSNGNTLLDIVATRGDQDVFSALLKRGFNVNALAKNNNTPLHLSARKGNVPFCSYLIKQGANLNAQDEYGLAPLHETIYENRAEACALLTSKGANVDIQNNDGTTPLMIAFSKGYSKIAKILIRNNANPTITDQSIRNASDYAIRNKYPNMIDLFDSLKAEKQDGIRKTPTSIDSDDASTQDPLNNATPLKLKSRPQQNLSFMSKIISFFSNKEVKFNEISAVGNNYRNEKKSRTNGKIHP